MLFSIWTCNLNTSGWICLLFDFFRRSAQLLLRKDPEKRPTAVAFDHTVKNLIKLLNKEKEAAAGATINTDSIGKEKNSLVQQKALEERSKSSFEKQKLLVFESKPRRFEINNWMGAIANKEENSNSPQVSVAQQAAILEQNAIARSGVFNFETLHKASSHVALSFENRHQIQKQQLFSQIPPVSSQLKELTPEIDASILMAFKRQKATCEVLRSMLLWKGDNPDLQKKYEVAKVRLDALASYIDSFAYNEESVKDMQLYLENILSEGGRAYKVNCKDESTGHEIQEATRFIVEKEQENKISQKDHANTQEKIKESEDSESLNKSRTKGVISSNIGNIEVIGLQIIMQCKYCRC